MADQEDAKRGLWEKAAKAKPQELEIQMRWFTYAFENDDWKSAQKVSAATEVFEKKRKKKKTRSNLYASYLAGCHESPKQLP